MADNQKFFQISTIPKRSGFGGRISKLYRKRQLVVSVIGAYVLIGGLLGYLLFNSANDSAKASNETASVTPIIDLVENEGGSYEVGDPVTLKITLQNRSSTESINNTSIEFFSTKNAVAWNEVLGVDDGDEISGQNSVFKLPILSAGERLEFTAQGTLQSDNSNFLTILAKVRYLNKEGQQEINSNRVFTELEGSYDTKDSLVTVSYPKTTFVPGEEIPITLGMPQPDLIPQNFSLDGTLFISRQGASDVINTIPCSFDTSGICSSILSGLEPGSYTSMFIDESGNFFSEISPFTVSGSVSSSVISQNSTINFPFGSRSINGLVPVYSERVVSLNDVVNPTDVCIYEIIQNDVVITSTQTPIKADRTCAAVINAAQIPTGDGVYIVKLAGTLSQREVSIVRKPVVLLSLQTTNLVFAKGSPVDILVTDIVDALGQPINGERVAVGIWQQSTGDFIELGSQNGETFIVQNGQFNVRLASDLFSQGGNYSIYVKTETGLQSDFVNLNFDDKEVGFVYSGVIVGDYSSLQVGKNMEFTLTNVTDKSGGQITSGQCSAAFYTSSTAATPQIVDGSIENGNCKVFVEAGTITKSGNILVSFIGDEIDNDIPQSRHFTIVPGEVTSYGFMNLEYEPARKEYANQLFVGPITDQYGNLTDVYNLQLEVLKDGEVVKVFENISSSDGFISKTLPASIFNSDLLSLRLVNEQKQELISREIVLVENTSKLILPSIDRELSGDENLLVSIPYIDESDAEVCKITHYRSFDQSVQEELPFDPETGVCGVDWNITSLRDVKKALVTVEVGSRRYTQVVTLTPGEASNLFVIAPQTIVNSNDDINLSLLTSIITDSYGLQLDKGEVKLEYNGRVEEAVIEDGVAQIQITADDLSSKDIRETFGSRNLDLSLEAVAGVTSLSKTNSLSIYLGDKDISLESSQFAINTAQSHIIQGSKKIFAFEVDVCRAIRLSGNGLSSQLLNTHFQGGLCYVQIDAISGSQTIYFEEDGNIYGTFDIVTVGDNHSVRWCENAPCILQVIAPLNSGVQVKVFDEDDPFVYQSDELGNVVTIDQNGLNPLKEYLVEVNYTNGNNQEIHHYRTLSGELLNSLADGE